MEKELNELMNVTKEYRDKIEIRRLQEQIELKQILDQQEKEEALREDALDIIHTLIETLEISITSVPVGSVEIHATNIIRITATV